ncbi:MAG: translation initiation factor IF-3 [Candidatus Taylorbacteria bacterium]|nr:translation initiation factor IF-3 [Candidatus Taylorbacteria bacterium]
MKVAYEPRIRINHQIRSAELRVIGDEGQNYGVINLQEALKKAQELGLDLIEISPNAKPPVAKIMDFGKYQYAENKKQKAAKAKSHVTEVKSIQVKVGTGEHDLALKAKQASEWLKDGHRVRVNLFLTGRAKYMEMKFFQERIERVLKLITEQYKISDTAKKGPKGVSLMIEKA